MGAKLVENTEDNPNFFGKRMVDMGIITDQQCEQIISLQITMKLKGEKARFGDIAVDKGYCAANDLETLPNLMGNKLVDAGLMSPKQKDALVHWQSSLRQKGFNVRFGELSVAEGFCTQSEINQLIENG